jgi:TonB family protein
MVEEMRRGRHAAVIAIVIAGCAVSSCASRSVQPTTVIVDSSATIPPHVVRQGELEIPAELRGRPCTSGLAVVEIEVGATGRVQRARVSRVSSEPAFDEACLRSARTAEFQPGTSHGKPSVGVTHVECRLECP